LVFFLFWFELYIMWGANYKKNLSFLLASLMVNYHFSTVYPIHPTHHEFQLHTYQSQSHRQCVSLHFPIKNLELEHLQVNWILPRCFLWVYQGFKVTPKRDFRVLKKNLHLKSNHSKLIQIVKYEAESDCNV
jgi:hypothetical protein